MLITYSKTLMLIPENLSQRDTRLFPNCRAMRGRSAVTSIHRTGRGINGQLQKPSIRSGKSMQVLQKEE